jgi:hypothetical protein
MHGGQRPLEHEPIEKDERVQRLILRARGYAQIDGQMREECLGLAEILGMATIAVVYEAHDPSDVGLLGANAVVADTDGGSHLLQER